MEIARVSYYKAPPQKEIRPYQIVPGYELVELMVDGEVFFDDGSGPAPRRCGHLFWHIPGDFTIHDNNPDFPYQCLCVLFKTDSDGPRHTPRRSFWDDEYEVRKFSDTMLKSFHSATADKRLLCDYAFHRLRWEAASGQARQREEKYPPPLRRAVEYIESNLSEAISMAEVAEYAGVSESHLFLLFRRSFGRTPHKHLNLLRIAEARQMLVKGKENIKEICEKCGFLNIESFYRVFRKHTGVSPGEYRKNFILNDYLSTLE